MSPETITVNGRLLAEALASCEALAAALLPVPVYVLSTSNGAPQTLGLPGSWGTAGRTLDVSARPWLESRGALVGRRPAIYIDDLAIRDAAFADDVDCNSDQRPGLFREYIRAIVIHELAHVVECGIDRQPVSPAVEAKAAFVAAYSASVVDDKGFPPWRTHTLQFVRAACHLRFRALQIGVDVNLGLLIPFQDYGLSLGVWYWQGLMDEMKKLAALSIFDIATIRPASDVLDLWRSDVTRWRDDQEHLSERASQICDNALSLFWG